MALSEQELREQISEQFQQVRNEWGEAGWGYRRPTEWIWAAFTYGEVTDDQSVAIDDAQAAFSGSPAQVTRWLLSQGTANFEVFYADRQAWNANSSADVPTRVGRSIIL